MLPKTAAGAKVFGGGGGKLKALGPGRPVWKVGDFEVQRCVYVDPMMSQPMMIQLDPPKGCVDTLDSVTDESGMPLETAAGAKVLCLRSAGRISLQKPSGGLSVGESHRCSGSHSLRPSGLAGVMSACRIMDTAAYIMGQVIAPLPVLTRRGRKDVP